MPFVFLALVPALVAWGGRALAVYGLSRLFCDESVKELKAMLEGWVIERVAHYSGLQLNPDDPFSDASLAGAVGERIGVPIRSLKNVDTIREDLDGFAAAIIQDRSGYRVRSIQNVAVLKEDLMQIGMAEFSGRLGIPAGIMPGEGVAFDAAAIRVQLLAWAKAEMLTQFEGEIQTAVAEISAAGGVVALAESMNNSLNEVGSIERVTSRKIAFRVANMMATQAVADYGKIAASGSKKSRRRESLRAAQAKFRAAHGNRQVYVPLGTSASIG